MGDFSLLLGRLGGLVNICTTLTRKPTFSGSGGSQFHTFSDICLAHDSSRHFKRIFYFYRFGTQKLSKWLPLRRAIRVPIGTEIASWAPNVHHRPLPGSTGIHFDSPKASQGTKSDPKVQKLTLNTWCLGSTIELETQFSHHPKLLESYKTRLQKSSLIL